MTDNALQLAKDAVAAWQGSSDDPLYIAIEALENISVELLTFEMAVWPEDGGGLNDELAHRAIASIQNRVDVAVQLVNRLESERKARL